MQRRSAALSLVLALTVVAAGCGGGGGEPAATDTAAAVDAGADSPSDGADGAVDAGMRCEGDEDCAAAFPALGPCELAVCDTVNGVCARGVRPEKAPCDDGDPCTLGSECRDGACTGGAPYACDDGDPCTDDACDGAGGCSATPAAEGVACDDGNRCTSADRCDGEGACAGADDGSCTCDDTADCTPWEDGDACNGVLVCAEGACVVAADSRVVCDTSGDTVCARTRCAPATGACVSQPQPDGIGCDDGDSCTTGDVCGAGACAGTADACPCAEDDDCAAFEDGDRCNGTLVCTDGACQVDPATRVSCPDDGPGDCRVAACVPETGACAEGPAPVGRACDDDDACTTGATCRADGSCGDGAALSCDDGEPCTDDTCDPVAGCAHAANTADCDDGNACTEGDACLDGACHAGTPRACDDGNACTQDSCNAETGCVNGPLDGVDCDDGDPCTGATGTPDRCVAGQCVGGDPCTCAVDADCAPLDDADACNGRLHCADARCELDAATVVVCPTGEDTACRKSTCAPATGVCSLQPVQDGVLCDDGDACTPADTCQGGVCEAGAPLDCDDDDVCTADSCAAGQCRNEPIPGCGVETCEAPDDCPDADPCTRDECGAGGVCTHTALGNGSACEDGDPCSGGDVCQAGSCVAGALNRCGGACNPAGTLACGDVVAATTFDFESTAFMASYSCSAEVWDGPEMAYVFVAQAAGRVTATLDEGAGLGLLVLRAEGGCDPLRCVSGDPDGGPLSWTVEPGQAWFVVVDGVGFAGGPFTLSVSCGSGEDCGNGGDDDGDGLVDCADPECASAPACQEADCADGTDDDGDGDTDCADGDCAAEAVCLPEGNCTNRVDDDFDGGTDCADADCAAHVTCIPETACRNGQDDDLDGATDCRDGDCDDDPGCVETACGDRQDNEGDGFTDCADADCDGQPGCYEDRCDNGLDDDRDGATDCRDADCDGDPLCVEALCGDGLDNDRDDLEDCADPDCFEKFPCNALCAPVRQIRCGEAWTGQTAGAERAFDDYGACLAGGNLSGPEHVYAFWPPRNGNVTFTLRNADFDAALLRLDELCRPPTNCAAAVDAAGEGGDEVLRFSAQLDTPVFVAVEGVGGDEGFYEVTLGCAGLPERDCDDGVDDDADGAIDCRDLDCSLLAPCAETLCTDGVDNNGDGTADCGDPSCAADPHCGEFDCANGVDDDLDALTDCDDPECRLHPVCGERCANDVDDDDDSLTDCQDPDCTGDEACLEDCANGADDEGDGLADCADPDCIAEPGCAETACADGSDDDADGATDCADLDCVGVAACRETACGDLTDNDGDGAADCADPDCLVTAACAEVACANDSDDDGDQLVDCDDLDCAAAPACVGDVCVPARVLGCGAALSDDLRSAAATDAFNLWPTCDLFGLDHGGAELAYDLPIACTGLYTVTAAATGAPSGFLDLLLLEGDRGCNDAACTDLAYGEQGGVALSFEAIAGERFTLVVDGVDGFKGPFDLELDCGGCTPQFETVCDDLRDDDDDLAVDCDDEDCAAAPACQQTCRPRGVVVCGDTVAGTLGGAAATDRNDGYPCDGYGLPYDGPEDTWSFVAPCTGPVTVTTLRTAGSGPRDVFVLRADAAGGCEADTCVAVGYMSESGVAQVSFGALEGARYALVVDSADGPVASYTLSVTCGCLGEGDCADGFDDDGDGRVDCLDTDCLGTPQCESAGACSPRATLTCDTEVAGDTSINTQNVVAAWSCADLPETGPEHVYRWVAPRTGLASAVLDIEGSHDLDLFVLEDIGGGCNPDACIGWSTRTSDEIAPFLAVAGREYFIVVDGYGGADGPYRLQVDCSPGCEVGRDAECGVPYDGDLAAEGASDTVGAYGCDAAHDDYSGPEAFWGFEMPCTGGIDVRLRRLDETSLIDLVRLGVSPVCDGTCAAIAKMDDATGVAVLHVTAEAGTRLLFAVDGRDGAVGPYRLEFDCAACLQTDVCHAAAEVGCGDTLSGTTAGRPSAFDFYGCSPVAWPGGEAWYAFEPTTSGPVTLSLSTEGALGVFLVEDSGDGCDAFACVAGTDLVSAGLVSAEVEANQRYFVIVDGETDEGANFAVDLECP